MLGDAVLRHLAVLGRNSTEGNQQLRVGDDIGPARRPHHRFHPPGNPRHDHRCRTERIVGHLIDESARIIEEPFELRGGGMECPGASPAGRGVYRLVAVFGPHSIDLRRCQVQRGIPLHGHERFHAAPRRIAAIAVFQPPPAHHRLRHAAVRVQHSRHGLDHRRRLGIVLERLNPRDTPVGCLHPVGAPV